MRSPAPADMAPPCPCQHCAAFLALGTGGVTWPAACLLCLRACLKDSVNILFRGRHNGAHKISPLTSPLSGVPTVRRTDYHACSASVSRCSGYWVFTTTSFFHI